MPKGANLPAHVGQLALDPRLGPRAAEARGVTRRVVGSTDALGTRATGPALESSLRRGCFSCCTRYWQTPTCLPFTTRDVCALDESGVHVAQPVWATPT